MSCIFRSEFACACLRVCVCVLLPLCCMCVMATQGGTAPFMLLYLVVDPGDFGGRLAPPFIPAEVPDHWPLRRTPEGAIRRWSWWRASAEDRLPHCLLLTYKLTAHGLGCALLGHDMVSRAHWNYDGSLSALRWRSLTLERVFWCEGLPMLVLENIQLVVEHYPEAPEYLESA